MFEVGLSELLMTGLVALVAIGPEKLPAVARHIGFWLGKLRWTIAAVKAEMQVEELRRQLISAELQSTLDDGKAAVMDIDAAMEALTDSAFDRNEGMHSS
jgi:sec-independent protein translocase protein TatB